MGAFADLAGFVIGGDGEGDDVLLHGGDLCLGPDIQAHRGGGQMGDVQLDATVSGTTQSIPLTGNMDMNMQYTLDPLEYSATGTMSGDASAMGMAGEAGMEMYMVNADDGNLTMYVKVSGLGEDAGGVTEGLSSLYCQQLSERIY